MEVGCFSLCIGYEEASGYETVLLATVLGPITAPTSSPHSMMLNSRVSKQIYWSIFCGLSPFLQLAFPFASYNHTQGLLVLASTFHCKLR